MNTYSSSLLIIPFFAFSIPAHADVKEVDRKDPRWKQAKQLTIKTDNKTKRIFEAEKAQDNSFFYIASQENTEFFWTEYQFKPKGNDETKNRVEPMFEWGIIPPGKTQAINKKELALGETVKDQARYEADLSSLQKPDSLKIACRMIAYWYNDGEKVNQPDTGKAKTSVIKPPSFKLKVKELAFNTVKGEIDSDSFDIQETINGKDISVPEFKDGKEQQGTVVAYPAQSRPIIRISAELSSDDIPAEQWKDLSIKLNAVGSNGDESLVQGKKFHSRKEMDMEAGAENNTQTVKGDIQAADALENEMKQGSLQLTWSAELEGGKLDCKAETSIANAFLILRQQEIEAGKGTPKLGKQALLAGAGHLLKMSDNKTALSRVTSNVEYANALVKGIIYHSQYPDVAKSAYTTASDRFSFTINLSSIVDLYQGNSGPKLICIDACGTLQALYQLMTDDSISARLADPEAKEGQTLPANAAGHAFNALNNKVYDGTPQRGALHGGIAPATARGGNIQQHLKNMGDANNIKLNLLDQEATFTIK